MNINTLIKSLSVLGGIILWGYVISNSDSKSSTNDDYWDELTNDYKEKEPDIYSDYFDKEYTYDDIPYGYTIVNGNSIIKISDIEDYDDVDDPGDLY